MRKITVLEMMTLDSVIQAPGSKGEDTSGNFEYGGWTAAYGDEKYREALSEEIKSTDYDYLLGRKTFEIWENYWPHHGDFWPGINIGTKYILSKTREKSDWKKTEFISGIDAIKKLKESNGPDIQVWGSSGLVQLLLENDLVDEFRLKIFPLTLGSGKKLFGNGVIPAAFALIDSSVTPKGVILANYRRDGEIKTGSIKV